MGRCNSRVEPIEAAFMLRVMAVASAQGMNQTKLARRSGMSRSALNKCVTGDRRISLSDAALLANAVKVSLSALLSGKTINLTIEVPADDPAANDGAPRS